MPKQINDRTQSRFFTRRELAAYLGVSYKWVQRHEKELPHVQIGSTILYPKEPFEKLASGELSWDEVQRAYRRAPTSGVWKPPF